MKPTRMTVAAVSLIAAGIALLFAGCKTFPVNPDQIDEWLQDWTADTVTNTVPTIITPAKPTQGEPEITWYKTRPAPDCKVDIVLRSITLNGEKATFDYDKITSYNADVSNTHMLWFVERDSTTNVTRIAGGKIDWMRAFQRVKLIDNLLGKRKKNKQTGEYVLKPDGSNVYSHYIEEVQPIKKGEKCWGGIMSKDGKHRSPIIEVKGTMPASRQ